MPRSRADVALDHLTVVDVLPSDLVAIAHEVGCRAVCLFLESMEVLPRMPRFSLVADAAERRETRRRCQALGVDIDLAYPFTLTGRTEVNTFRPMMEMAAELGVQTLNTLLYDRDPQRRFERFAAFCELAIEHGASVAVEFYPLSQVRLLREALDLVTRVNRPGEVGVNIDLLHLMRSGGQIEELAAAPAGFILYAQYCDAPLTLDPQDWGWEASHQRELPGAGQLEVGRFAAALPPDLRCSVEVPQAEGISLGVAPAERASRAVAAARRAVAASSGRQCQPTLASLETEQCHDIERR